MAQRTKLLMAALALQPEFKTSGGLPPGRDTKVPASLNNGVDQWRTIIAGFMFFHPLPKAVYGDTADIMLNNRAVRPDQWLFQVQKIDNGVLGAKKEIAFRRNVFVFHHDLAALNWYSPS